MIVPSFSYNLYFHEVSQPNYTTAAELELVTSLAKSVAVTKKNLLDK